MIGQRGQDIDCVFNVPRPLMFR